jgi:UDP-N-acetylmuramyl pentapeptide synthase
VPYGAAFLGLRGPHFDGSEFAAEAMRNGARALIVSRGARDDVVEAALARRVAVLEVDDGLNALHALASYHRERLHAVVIAITGSSGKTTTKDFVDSVLSTRMTTTSTTGNRNNEIGMPLTLLAASTNTEAVVLEMGMRGAARSRSWPRSHTPTWVSSRT